jgi:hypothetical protein
LPISCHKWTNITRPCRLYRLRWLDWGEPTA